MNTRVEDLLRRFAANTINQDDYLELIAYFKLEGNDEEISAALDAIWNEMDNDNAILTDGQLAQAYHQLTHDKRFATAPVKMRVLRRLLPYAAAAVLLISGTAGYLLLRKPAVETIAQRYKNDVAPGSNKATLTLANGKVVNLTGNNVIALAQQSGAHIIKAQNGQLVYSFSGGDGSQSAFNTLNTPVGGQYQVVLPDGSHVWINASSSLTFPVQFAANERKVTLKGEAYFEVAKNAAKPFRVITGAQEVEVHGTHFDVKAYADEPGILTTLLEGAVSIKVAGKTTPLQPGQQASDGNGQVNVYVADTEEAVAWKNGLFMYTDENLESIMKQVARWYDITVVYQDDDLKKQVFSGTLSRFKNISQLLEVLEATGSVHFKIEGRRITVMN